MAHSLAQRFPMQAEKLTYKPDYFSLESTKAFCRSNGCILLECFVWNCWLFENVIEIIAECLEKSSHCSNTLKMGSKYKEGGLSKILPSDTYKSFPIVESALWLEKFSGAEQKF